MPTIGLGVGIGRTIRRSDFQPSDDPGVVQWYDARWPEGTLHLGSPAANGETVTAFINRKSPGNFDLAQADAIPFPVFEASTNSIIFTGVVLEAVGFPTVQAFMAVVQGGLDLANSIAGADVFGNRFGILYPDENTWYSDDNDPFCFINVDEENGVATTVHDPSEFVIVYGMRATSATVAANFWLGASNSESAWNGRIGEFITWTTTPSSEDKERMLNYLATKWGIEI